MRYTWVCFLGADSYPERQQAVSVQTPCRCGRPPVQACSRAIATDRHLDTWIPGQGVVLCVHRGKRLSSPCSVSDSNGWSGGEWFELLEPPSLLCQGFLVLPSEFYIRLGKTLYLRVN